MKRIIPLIIILAALGGGYWWYTNRPVAAVQSASADGRLAGSGSIEAETVSVTAELGGRIVALHAAEGDEVTAGQLLIELDQADLLAQQIQLEAGVETAQANLALTSASALPEDVALAEAQLAQAEAVRDGAELVWQQAQRLVANPHELEAAISQMRAQVTEAEKQLEMARVNLKRAEIQAEAAGRNQSNNAALAENESAQYQLQAAQQAVQMAEVALAGTQTQVEHLIGLKERPLTLIAQANSAEAAFHQAEAAVLLAQANLTAAKAEARPEDVNLARAQLAEAESALEIVRVQLAKQQLTAPRAGLVAKKLANPGELAAPGAELLQLSDIEQVDLTVYIPETQIGRVQVNQKAQVWVDAWPGESFAGRVSFIAHEAEFTPKNVQTEEERVNLVFAVKITLDNPGHRLKPGMPADAEILPEMWPAAQQPAVSDGEQDAFTPPTPAKGIDQNGAAAGPTPTPRPATATPAPTPSPLPQPTAQPQVEVLAWGLTVRAGPAPDAPVAGYLSQGEVLPLLDTTPDGLWLQIRLPDSGETGWISGNQTFVKRY
ncbi:MAG: hypothetical protein Kow0031_26510 [Anaerolineae bacterium]